jgi:hypothetical protein
MIQAWLAKNALKGGIIIAVIATIFFSGYHVKGKLVEAKILRMENRYSVLDSNYNQCVDQVSRTALQIKEFEGVLASQNAEIQKLHDDGVAAVARAKRLGEIALANERASYDRSMRDMMSRYTSLNEQFTLLTASESCHLAWLEVTQ